MVNLIELQNQLKNLGDEELQGEAQTPSGSAPPFLVLTELNRRKSMRDAYTAQQNRRQPSTTVAEDLMMSPVGTRGQPRAGAPQGSGGIGIAAALPGAPTNFDPASEGGIPAFADGGLVGSDIMENILKRRNATLNEVDGDRDRLLGRSLMAAGGAMMSNGSANFMKNLGAGVTGGITAWDQGAELMDSRESAAIDDIMNISDAERAERLARMDESFRRDDLAQRGSQYASEMNKPTTDMQNYDAFSSLDEEGQAEWMRVNGSSSSAAGLTPRYAMQAYNGTMEDVRKEVMSAYEMDPDLIAGTPEEKAAVQAKMEAEIKSKTDARFLTVYPDYASLMPELTAASAGGTATPPAGAQDWSTYFTD